MRALSLTEDLKREARARGLSLMGITLPDRSVHAAFFEDWLARGHHGEMDYLAREDAVARRRDLKGTMPTVRSVLVVGQEYFQEDPLGMPDDPSRAIVARYARGSDYHDVLKARLVGLLRWLDERVEGGVQGRAYVDTGPILERELAQRAGLGWFGRNTMLINPSHGSYFFLGVLLLDCELAPDTPFEEDRCGTCRACLDACPTGALLGRDDRAAPVIDARRCISYLTIELRGPIPIELRSAMGNRIFGRDICQEVCPWNGRFPRLAGEAAYSARDGMDGPSLVGLAESLLNLDEKGFRDLFWKSPIRRTKRAGLLRNVCVALGNWGSGESLDVLVRALDDDEALVRGHAAWALGRLGSAGAGKALSSRVAVEDDDFVRAELSAALG